MPTPQKKERRGAKASISIPALIPAKTHKDTQSHTEQTILSIDTASPINYTVYYCGGFDLALYLVPRKPQMSALLFANTDHRMTEHSTLSSLGNVFWVQNATTVQKE